MQAIVLLILYLLQMLLGSMIFVSGSASLNQATVREVYPADVFMETESAMDGVIGGYAPALYGIPAAEPTTYDAFVPLSDPGFVRTSSSPLSTFAADVDTAAYATIRRLINDQQRIPRDAVRIEEMVNAFSYNDPAPTGDAPLAIHAEVAPCPWNLDHLLLRACVKAAKIDAEALPPSNLVFLIDSSGSMDEPDKLPLVQRSFALLAEQLRPEDRVSIVTYAGSSEVLLEGARGDEKAAILGAINDIWAGGDTAGAQGLMTAYELAARYAAPGMNSRVLLATDGDFNIGINSEADLIRFIEEQKESGIFLTVLGFGMGNLQDNKMQAMAEHGNGNATYIDTIHQARQALVEEIGATLVTIAKDVKLQVEFNPGAVEGYRLIGYESRRMANEDFRNDAKDGGEIGSGHTVVALYEIIPAGAGEMADEGLKYQTATSADSDDFATLYVRYKQPDGDTAVELQQVIGAELYTETPGRDFVLSAAIAAFGQLLSGSDYAGDADEQMVLEMLQPMLSEDTGGRIVELSALVRRSGGLYGDE